MLVSIEQVSNLGIFQNYKKKSGLQDFGRFNVIYGLNGSGKTTLSRLLACLNTGGIEAHPDLKYSGKSSSGTFKEGVSYPRKIRVFNSEYVGKNIGEIEGQLNPIFIIGEEDKSLVTQIQADETALGKLTEEVATKRTAKAKAEKERGSRFTEIAKTILADTRGAMLRNYNKTNAEAAFTKISKAELLDDDELQSYRTTLQQKVESALPLAKIGMLTVVSGGSSQSITINDALAKISASLPMLCDKTAESIAIQRLQENADIAQWVETGIQIHAAHETSTCEYCRQIIPSARIAELAKHFNDSDQQLKAEIEEAQDWVKSTIAALESIIPPGQGDLYDELKPDYAVALKAFAECRNAIIATLQTANDTLTNKLASRTQPIPCEVPTLDGSPLDTALTEINKHLEAHNAKSEAFSDRTEAARTAIETHHLSGLIPDIKIIDDEIKAFDQRLNEIKGGKADGTLGTDALVQRIRENKQKVSKTAQAAKNLTEQLHTFLGRSDLTFEPEGDGYRIMRGGEAAQRLSEGEKTAITFIYFIVQLADQDFDVSEGIVVIDDPISSLDSNSVYQAFSFLKNAVKDAKQVFLLTHNFDFLRLLLNWGKGIPKKEAPAKSFYMLTGVVDTNGDRSVKLGPLDATLMEHDTEYAFLFKTLYDFKSDGTIIGSYHIPNVARKLLEAFLSFYYPGPTSMYQKLQKVQFDENKKTAIYKFTNDQSHATSKGFDPALIQESQTNAKHLLDMIKNASSTHFASLEELVSPTTT